MGVRTVLILDDYPSVLSWASRAFLRAGWQVLTANCSAEAIDGWHSAKRDGTPVDLLVIDLGLPEQDGTSIARALRTLDPSLFVIGITSHPDRGAAWNAALRHRSAFFQKPMMASELLRAANAYIDTVPIEHPELGPVEPVDKSMT